MKRRPGRPEAGASGGATPEAPTGAILQIKVWLEEISPMIWWRVLAPASFTLRELHGVIQVAMGWEDIHLFQPRLRAGCFGSPELWAASPDVTLAAQTLPTPTNHSVQDRLVGRDLRARPAARVRLGPPWPSPRPSRLSLLRRLSLPPHTFRCFPIGSAPRFSAKNPCRELCVARTKSKQPVSAELTIRVHSF